MSAAFKGRREDARLITGQGRYSADWSFPGQLHASFLRSDRAHAEIVSLEIARARAAPGVVAVLTGRDTTRAGFKSAPSMVKWPGRGGAAIKVPHRQSGDFDDLLQEPRLLAAAHQLEELELSLISALFCREYSARVPAVSRSRDGARATLVLRGARHPLLVEQLRRGDEWHPCHGLKLQYSNPATGGYPMPTIGAFVQLLPKGFRGKPYRSTDGTIYAVAEGHGTTVIGEEEFAWGPRDVFVVPSWARHAHRAREEAVLFSAADRPVHQKLDLWREERGNAPSVAS